MTKLFANSGDPDQKPHSVAFVMGLRCLPIPLLGISRPNWVNIELVRKTIILPMKRKPRHLPINIHL